MLNITLVRMDITKKKKRGQVWLCTWESEKGGSWSSLAQAKAGDTI
jgi:hypothetical protein